MTKDYFSSELGVRSCWSLFTKVDTRQQVHLLDSCIRLRDHSRKKAPYSLLFILCGRLVNDGSTMFPIQIE